MVSLTAFAVMDSAGARSVYVITLGLPRALAELTGLQLGDDLFCEGLEVTDLGVQRLGVLAHGVGDSEADDDVGNALVLKAFDAVEGERVE